MNGNPRRALVVVSKMDAGGAESMMMKYYRALDKNHFQLDFCVSDNGNGFYDNEIRLLGGRIFQVAKKSKQPLRAFSDIYHLVRLYGYDAVMRNAANAAASFDLFAARMGGARIRILRSTNTSIDGHSFRDYVAHYVGRFVLKAAVTTCVAPSEVAAKFMFGNTKIESGQYVLLPNAINDQDYRYDEECRQAVRTMLGIDQSTLLLGSVGRLVEQKNQKYDIAVLSELVSRGIRAHLVLLGKGPLAEELESTADAAGVREFVHFLPPTHDVASYYSAFDVLLLPSHFEGLPNVLVEAQASGLTCVVSDSVTSDAAYTPYVVYLGTNRDDVTHWADACRPNSSSVRRSACEYLKLSQFDMENAIVTFENLLFPSKTEEPS